MPAFATSSRPFSAALTPVGCEPEWRIALLTAALALSAIPLLAIVPAPARLAPLAALLCGAAIEFAALARQAPPPRRLRLSRDGRLVATIGTRDVPAALLPGGLFTARFAWIHWRAEGQRRGRWTLVLHGGNEWAWRRARLIWRWAPRPEAPAPFV